MKKKAAALVKDMCRSLVRGAGEVALLFFFLIFYF